MPTRIHQWNFNVILPYEIRKQHMESYKKLQNSGFPFLPSCMNKRRRITFDDIFTNSGCATQRPRKKKNHSTAYKKKRGQD
jgi:hypothetical protein